MKDTNTIVPVSSNIIGNIGSCAIKETRYNISTFRVEVTAVDSCTGKILASNQMFDGTWFFIIPLAIFILGLGTAFIKALFSDY